MAIKTVQQSPHALAFSIRFRVIFKYLGQLCLIAALLSFVTLIVSIIWQEYFISIRYLIIIIFLTFLWILSRKIEPINNIQSNEACFIISFIFILTSFLMVYPMMGSNLNFIDAWFESVSALTTTGLSTIESVEDKLKTFLFARAFMQWYGGLGIVALSLGLSMQPSSIARKLSLSLSSKKDLVSSTKPYARKIFATYLSLTLLCVGFVWIFKAPFYNGLIIALSAVSTGGFSPYDDSIAKLSTSIQTTVIIFSSLGGISLPLYWLFRVKDVKKMSADLQLSMFILFGITTAAILFGIYYYNSNFSFKMIKSSLLNAFSAQSTAGFSTINIPTLTNNSKMILIISMMIGGCTNSTAGGIKVIRFLILLKGIHTFFFRTALSKNSIYYPRLGKLKLQTEDSESSLSIFVLFLIFMFISWFIFVTAGYKPIDSLFEVVSASATVGLSSGITSTSLPNYLKVILGLNMLMGRLEMITFLVTFYPRTLIGKRRHN